MYSQHQALDSSVTWGFKLIEIEHTYLVFSWKYLVCDSVLYVKASALGFCRAEPHKFEPWQPNVNVPCTVSDTGLVA